MRNDPSLGIVVVIMLFIAYLLPALVAMARRHHNAGAILTLNVLLGWTLLGWIVSLVWAMTAVVRPSARS